MKDKIIQQFNLASDSYQSFAKIQQSAAQILVKNLINHHPNFVPNKILDIGTGSGVVVESLIDYFPKANYSLNDISPLMLKKAQLKLADLLIEPQFIIGDLEEIEFKYHQLITANFVLQWVDNLDKAISKLAKASQVIAFSCLIENTFAEWNNLFINLGLKSPGIIYPNTQTIIKLIEQLKPKSYNYFIQNFELTFKSLQEFTKYLKLLGARITNQPVKMSYLKNIINNNPGSFNTNYCVMFNIVEIK